LEKIKEKQNFDLASGKTYIQYLRELSTYKFCLCIRGNGIDTHRFWESLYLGVVPVIINNNTTNSSNFVKYLKRLNIPFYEIVNDNLDNICTKYTNDFFNEKLYNEIIKNTNSSIYNLESLKISFYR
jgi:putative cell wall-binding protein